MAQLMECPRCNSTNIDWHYDLAYCDSLEEVCQPGHCQQCDTSIGLLFKQYKIEGYCYQDGKKYVKNL